MQDEAASVKQFLSATCFKGIATVLDHLDKINIDLNLRCEFQPLRCDFQGDSSSVTHVLCFQLYCDVSTLQDKKFHHPLPGKTATMPPLRSLSLLLYVSYLFLKDVMIYCHATFSEWLKCCER